MATVSRVLNGTKTVVRISDKTRKRVLEAAHGLNYQPNIFAKCLRLKKSFTIGLVVGNIEDYFFGPVIKGIEKVLRPSGYHFIVVDSENSGEKELLCVEDLLRRRVDGILTASYFMPPLTTVRQPLEELGRKGASLLLSIISRQHNGGDAGRRIVLQPKLIIRETTATTAVKNRQGGEGSGKEATERP